MGGARQGGHAPMRAGADGAAKPRQVRDEAGMAAAAVRLGLVLAVPVLGLAAWLRGVDGALTAAFGLALVVGGFALTGRSLAWAGRRSTEALMAVALGGFLLRLVLYAALIVLLRDVEGLDGPVLAVTVATALVAVLGYEVRLVLRHGELWWLHDTKEQA